MKRLGAGIAGWARSRWGGLDWFDRAIVVVFAGAALLRLLSGDWLNALSGLALTCIFADWVYSRNVLAKRAFDLRVMDTLRDVAAGAEGGRSWVGVADRGGRLDVRVYGPGVRRDG